MTEPLSREQLEARLAELHTERADLLREQPFTAPDQGDRADGAEALVERETTEAVIALLDERIRLVEEHIAELDRAHIHTA